MTSDMERLAADMEQILLGINAFAPPITPPTDEGSATPDDAASRGDSDEWVDYEELQQL